MIRKNSRVLVKTLEGLKGNYSHMGEARLEISWFSSQEDYEKGYYYDRVEKVHHLFIADAVEYIEDALETANEVYGLHIKIENCCPSWRGIMKILEIDWDKGDIFIKSPFEIVQELYSSIVSLEKCSDSYRDQLRKCEKRLEEAGVTVDDE